MYDDLTRRRTTLPRMLKALLPAGFAGMLAAAALCGCTSEDAPPPPPPEPLVETQGRQSTLGRAVDVAERTRDQADAYNEAIEKAADDLHR